MTARPTMTRAGVVLALSLAVLTGCSAPVSSGTPGGAAPAAPPAPSSTATPDPDSFPTCDEVKAALGPEVAGLIELPESENGVSTGSLGPSLGCAWHTPETDGSSIHIEEYGGISVGLSRDPEMTEESMQSLGWNVDDPTVAGAGAWALKVGGGYDPAAQLDAVGVQVVRDGVVAVLTSGGVVLQDVPGLASLTNEWALKAGVAMLDLMD